MDVDDAEGTALLKEKLLRVVGWVTPNLDELSTLTGIAVKTREQATAAAEKLAKYTASIGNRGLGIVVTGGHLDRPEDYLLVNGSGEWLRGEWVETISTHGTGCAFSAAFVAGLAHEQPAREAVEAAKRYVAGAMLAAYPVGQGHGPLHHLYPLS